MGMKRTESREQLNDASAPSIDHSDQALHSLLARIKVTDSPAEFRRLSDQIRRVIFHKQFENA
jgi:hypothetical protein